MKHVSLEHIGSSMFGDIDTSMYEFEIELESSSLIGYEGKVKWANLLTLQPKTKIRETINTIKFCGKANMGCVVFAYFSYLFVIK